MKKRILICMLAILCLCGCGKDKTVSLDVKKLGDQLADELSYDDQLTQLSEEMSRRLYCYTDQQVEESRVYVSTGATTEEIAVFRCVDEDEAQSLENAARRRIQTQIESVRNYQPAEVERLENALVQRYDCYLVVSISNEPQQAKEIIQKYL